MSSVVVFADNDVMITRDGIFIEVKIEKISTTHVTFIDLKRKKRGRQQVEVTYVYMILKDKGNNIFFDEDGTQITMKPVKIDKKASILYMNNGEIIPAYNVLLNKETISYQLKDNKKSPTVSANKTQVFLLKNEDGTSVLFNDSYTRKLQEAHNAKVVNTSGNQAIVAQSGPTTIINAPMGNLNTNKNPNSIVNQNTPQDVGQNTPQLLASNPVSMDFFPAPDMDPAELEMKINAINPYVLYRKGSIAEYCFQYKGKPTQYRGGPTYVEQEVADEKIENGLLVAYHKQNLYNKKHEPSKGIVASFKEYLFPTEVDTAGTYHLTHNIAQDFLLIEKRQGFGVMIPAQLYPGMKLKCGILKDSAKNMFGGIVKVTTTYSDWEVVGDEQIQTPAGLFDSVKLTGFITQKNGSQLYKEKIVCWMSRGVGVVRYDASAVTSKGESEPFILYLNRLELK